MDKTFDSLNASKLVSDPGKPLTGAVNIESESIHINHWNKAIKLFESMKFIDKNTKIPVKRQPPCITNWVFTLKSFKYLWFKLKKQYSFKFLLTRNINQDSLECFFGNIRSHGHRNINPDCFQFVLSFKTLLINNLTSIKSAGNCESDNSELLDNLKQLLTYSPLSIYEEKADLINIPIIHDVYNYVSTMTDMNIEYVAGYLARNILKTVDNCKSCKKYLVTSKRTNALILARDYTGKSLVDPNFSFFNTIKEMLHISKYIVPIIMEHSIGYKLTKILDIYLEPINYSCSEHNLKHILFQKFKSFYFFTLSKNINRILNGLDSRIYSNDSLKIAARQYYLKYKFKKNSCKQCSKLFTCNFHKLPTLPK